MKKLAYVEFFSLNMPETSGNVWYFIFVRIHLVFSLSLPFVLNAQYSPHPSFQQYTTDDGLASSEVYHIIQDDDGYIWISSDNGVSRWDGYSFRNYGLEDGLVENVIFMMQLDTIGRVWMQGINGNLYYTEGDSILPYWNNEILLSFKGEGLSKGFIVEGAGETVHFATYKFGVVTIYNNGITKSYPHDEYAYRQIFVKNGIAINSYFESSNNELLQPFIKNILEKNSSGPVYFHKGENDWFPIEFIYSKINGSATGSFYLGNNKYLYQLYDDIWFIENGEVKWQHHFPFQILHASLTINEQLLLGLHYHNGLKVFNAIDSLKKDKSDLWLRGESVSYFMQDRDGGRWFATNENGVFYAPSDPFKVYDIETGLPDNKVTAVAIKNDSELYAGFDNGVVWNINFKNRITKSLPQIPTNGLISDLFYHPEYGLWAGKQKLFLLKQNQWEVCQIISHSGLTSMANNISVNPDSSRIWTSNHFGFMSVEMDNKIPNDINSGYGQRAYIVREDYSANIWVGRPDGLFEYRDSTLIGRQSLHPSFSLRIEDIALLPDSSLAIATKGAGIVFWKDELFEEITTKEGLTANMLECLYVDHQGILWAGTLNGLNRISGTFGNRKIEQITLFHGLPSNEINDIGVLNNNVWVATNNGLVHFKHKTSSAKSPNPFIVSITAKNNIDLSKPIELKANDNNLVINFSTINYKMNGKIPYRYKMDDNEWTETYNRSLNFPALPSGDRIFEVQSQNEDGIWSMSTKIDFVINPPWWASIWFRSILFLIIAGSGFIFYKYRTNQIRKAHNIRLQITELERSALQAQMNPHFIFNCLNSIQNFIVKNDSDSAIKYLGKFATLIRSTLNASVKGKIPIAEELRLLNNYLELEKLRFKNQFSYSINIADEIDTYEIEIPPLLIQPYVENALKHGISGKSEMGEIKINFNVSQDYLLVSIYDNGTGITSKHNMTVKDKSHKSFGMSITKNRLDLISDSKNVNSVDIQALTNKSADIVGTLVKIKISLKK
ncbi:MAG: histidine kinase [Bacteroidia bacterium]|nr:histidine kinase [Bacteroidia bacterium]